MLSSMLFAVQAAAPRTVEWSPTVGIVMSLTCLFALAVGRPAIQKRSGGPSLPVQLPALFDGFSLPELLATMSFGHILGAGLILGLSNAGVL